MLKIFNSSLLWVKGLGTLLLLIGLTLSLDTNAQVTPQFYSSTYNGGGNSYPFRTGTAGNKVQWLFQPGKFTDGTNPAYGGLITSVYIKATSRTSGSYKDLKVELGHTSLTTLTSGTWESGLTKCFEDDITLTPNSANPYWVEIPLTTPFLYNPKKGLILSISNPSYSGGFTINQETVSYNGRKYGNQSGTSSRGAGRQLVVAGIDVKVPGPNNAGVAAIDSPTTFCAGVQDIWATIQNSGSNQLDSVRVNWSINGVAQKTLFHTTVLDTVGGKGSQTASVKLGSYNFTSATDVKVWTSNPNGVKDTVNGNDTLEVSKGPSLSGTFSVGGTSPDYTDLIAAASDLTQYGVCGPVTLNVAPGIYNGQVVLGDISGTSSTNTITIVGSGNSGTNKSTISHSAGSGTRATLLLSGADWVTLKDFEILARGTSYGYGVQFTQAADHNTIENCVITVNATSRSANFIGILGSSSLTGTGYGNNGNWNTIIGNQVTGGYYGIRFDGAGTTTPVKGNRVIDNDFDRAHYYGAYLYYHDSVEFTGNSIQNLRNGTLADGLMAYFWSNSKIISNNIDAGDYGVYAYYMNRYNYNGSDKSEVHSNIIRSRSDYGFYSYRSENFEFYHNTVHTTGTYTTYFYISPNAEIVNNILVNNRSNGYTMYLNNTSPTNLDYNIYHNYNSNGRIANHSGAKNTLLAWQAAFPAYNVNSYSFAPDFVNVPSDMHLNSSSNSPRAKDVGVMYDVDGDARCGFAPSIGADEGSFSAVTTVGFQKIDTIWANSFTTILNTASANDPKTHKWYVDGNLVSEDLHLTDTFKTTGTIDIKLVTQSCGGVDSLTRSVVVSNPLRAPIPDFVASKTDPLVYETIQLIDISQDGPTSYRWKISPDSVYDPVIQAMAPSHRFVKGTKNSPNPFIEFDFDGTYDVGLVVSNPFGSDSLERSEFIRIKATQNMCIFPFETELPAGLLYDEGGPLADYRRNSNCDYLIDPCATEVTLEFNEFSLGSSDYLRVYDGEDNTGTPLWDATTYPNGMLGNKTHASFVSKMTAKTGKMYIHFTSNNSSATLGPGWEAEWSSKPITTMATPVASFLGLDTVCVDIPVSFENASTGDQMDFEWFVDGFSVATSEDLTSTFTVLGKSKIELVATNCGGSHTYSKTIVVADPKSAPTPDFSISNDKPNIGEKVLLTDASTYCRDRWEWIITPKGSHNFVSGTDSSSQNAVVEFTTAGVYTVALAVGNATGIDTLEKTNHITVLNYCTPSVAYINKDLGISRVLFADIDNATDIGDEEYTDYTLTHGTNVEVGAAYPITLERERNSFAMTRNVWIDYNRDGDFDDTGELVASESTSRTLSWTDTVKIPSSAEIGTTRMRIGTNSGSNKNVSCGPHFNGEFEDYKIVITPDVAAPELTLIGADTMYLSYCDTFTEPGVVAIDNVDGNITANVVYGGSVSTSPGTTELTYYVEDANKNASQITRTVIRDENLVPIQITISGKEVDTIEVFDSYTDLGITTSHSCAVVMSRTDINSLDSSKLGTYTITYTVEDSFNNLTTATRTIHVVDRTAPSITYTGTDTVNIEVFGSFTMPKSDATDNYDPAPVVTIKGGVDTAVVGSYVVTYCAEDQSGNTTCVDLIVNVEDLTAPTVSLKGDATVLVDVFGVYVDRGIDITDNYYTQFDVVTSGTWAGETDVLGTFTQTYTVTDGSGNTATIDRTIEVVDREEPKLYLEGPSVVYLERWDEWTDPGTVVKDNYDQAPVVSDVGTYVNTQSEGIFEITYTAEDQSGNKSVPVTRTIVVGPRTSIENPLADRGVEIYPNPTNGQVTVEINLDASEPISMRIVDVTGRTVIDASQIAPNADKVELSLSHLNDGVYFMHLQTGTESIVKQIVKE